MRRVCSVETVRAAEAGAGVSEPELMARAATGLAGVCLDLLRASRCRVVGAQVVALVGSGNNGGDALWALALLAARGVGTIAVGDPGRMHSAGAAALRAAGGRILAWSDPDASAVCVGSDLALDGIVGIGGRGGLRAEPAQLVAALASAGVPMVAVDIPSGVDADTGEVSVACVRADVTVTFGVVKPGLVLHPGSAKTGLLTVKEIGLRSADLDPCALMLSLSDLDLPGLEAGAHKYTRGVVAVTAGSASYPGAVHLAVRGARGSGVGMVKVAAGPGADPAAVVAAHPDVVIAGDPIVADAHLIGCGLGELDGAREMVMAALADPAPLVLDASALSIVAGATARRALVERSGRGLVSVITPHEGEFQRLGFSLVGGRMRAARTAAAELGVVVVLKGPGTVIAEPGSAPVFIDPFGGAELATAGSGDVLAGLCAGRLAVAARALGGGIEQSVAARAVAGAVGLHGLAGRLAAQRSGAVTATDIADQLGAAALRARNG